MGKIEELPDDVIALILTNLTIAEAARTAVLSRRWEHLYDSVPCLHFDAADETVDGSEAQYVSWVSKVLDSRLRNNFTVEELKINCCLGENYIEEIDKWVRFAVVKQVERFDLELGDPQNNSLSERKNCEALSGLFNLKCLRSLRLASLQLTAEFIECILSTCPLLEHLSLYCAGKFTHLNVSGVRLRKLEIAHLHKLMLTKLYAPRLHVFLLYGSHSWSLINVPELSTLTFVHSRPQAMSSLLFRLRSHLAQLQKINLYINKLELKNLPVLSKLKYLSLRVESYDDCSWRSYIDLAKACPILESLMIYLEMFLKLPNIKNEKVEMEKEHRFESLRELIVCSNDAEVIDSKLMEYCVGNSPCLEFIYIQPLESHDLEVNQAMKKKCRAMSRKLPVQTRIFFNSYYM